MDNLDLMLKYLPIITAAITLIGWFVTYRLTVSAQKRNLHNQILNQARIEITEGIRLYQKSLQDIISWLDQLKLELDQEELGMIIDWPQKLQDYIVVTQRNNSDKWNQRIEDYIILFQSIEPIRNYLRNRDIYLIGFRTQFIFDFWNNTNGMDLQEANSHRLRVIEQYKNHYDFMWDQVCLFEDLRLYFQNYCLGIITENRAPYRRPLDEKVPRIIINEGGVLHLEGDDIEKWSSPQVNFFVRDD